MARDEMDVKCTVLLQELKEVLHEATLPKVSDQCDEDDDKSAAVGLRPSSSDDTTSFSFVKSSPAL